MTKAELIRKIVKRSGIPDSEAKVFFEIFLQKTSGMLRPGQAVKLNDFGYFQLRLAVFNITPAKPVGKINQINTEVIVFTHLNGGEEEGLIFNIPAVVTGKFNFIDSYFSLSEGKPVIPLMGVRNSDYFIMPTGYEMKKLIESKVDKLLEDVEILKDFVKDNEILFLKKASFNEDQGESNWSMGKLNKEKLNPPAVQKNSGSEGEPQGDNNFNNISWDFGEDLSRQIEEEAIIDESSEIAPSSSNDEPAKKSSLEWEFSEQFSAKKTNEYEQDRIDNRSDITPDNEDDTTDFQRVKAITSEFSFDDIKSEAAKFEEKLAWDFGGNEKSVNDELIANDENNIVNETPGNEKFKQPGTKFNDAAGSITHSNASKSPYTDSGLLSGENKPVTSFKNASERTRSREYYYSGKKSLLPFLIALFTIILVSAVVFMYLNKISLYDLSSGHFFKSGSHAILSAAPSVIERSYDVPVTYPYPKYPDRKTSVDDNDLNSVLNIKSNSSVKTYTPKTNTGTISNILKNQEMTGKKNPPDTRDHTITAVNPNSQKIKENIFQQGNSFIVQVSSWPSKSVAIREAAKFKAKGFVPYIEQAEIPGRGTWFRVKVGDFKTFIEAEKFSGKNK
jgi:hypothetical protein